MPQPLETDNRTIWTPLTLVRKSRAKDFPPKDSPPCSGFVGILALEFLVIASLAMAIVFIV